MLSVALIVSPRGLRTVLALLVLIVAIPLESTAAAGSPAAGSQLGASTPPVAQSKE
jgi:hypothetical protein